MDQYFKPDVRLIQSTLRPEGALLRGITALWMPTFVARWLWEKGPDSLGTDVANFLRSQHFTAEVQSSEQLSRNVPFIDAVCETSTTVLSKLATTVFVIWGCGGLGTSTAIQLASLGAKNFLLVDGDHLETSNLNRATWFTSSDVGRLKVDVLHDFLTDRFPVIVSRIDRYLGPSTVHSALSQLGDTPAVLCLLVDNRGSAQEIVAALGPAPSLPYVHAGYAGPYCIVGPAVLSSKDPCPFCLSDDFEIIDDGAFIAPSASPNNLLISAFLVVQIIRFLADELPAIHARRWSFDIRTGNVSWTPILVNPSCRWCS